MRSYRFRLAVIILMFATSAPLPWLIADSVVEEQPKVSAEPVPATEEKPKEAGKAQARVSAEAQGLIDKVAGAYQKLTSLELGGNVTRVTDDGTNKRTHEAAMRSMLGVRTQSPVQPSASRRS